VCAVVTLPVVFMIRWLTGVIGVPGWMGFVAVGLFAVTVYQFVMSRVMYGRAVRLRIAAITYYRRCPQCVSRLDGLVVDESDGCVQCPECGCAWKVSRFGGEEVARELRTAALRLKGAPGWVGEGSQVKALAKADPIAGHLKAWFAPGLVVRDARGRVVKLCRADLMDVPREHREAIEVVRRARVLEAAGTWKRRWANGLAGMVLLAFLGWGQYLSVSRSWKLYPDSTAGEIAEKALRIFGAFFMVVIFGAMVLRVFMRSRPLSRKPYVRALVGEGLCPSCAAKLGAMRRDEEADAAEAEDKSDVKWVHDCPKCRAVWGVNG